jgi:hypothetical protein
MVEAPAITLVFWVWGKITQKFNPKVQAVPAPKEETVYPALELEDNRIIIRKKV